MVRTFLRFSLASILFTLVPSSSSARVVVNELYYDHPGADAGFEFVELVDTEGRAVDLSGLSLEFHNGSGVGWSVVWRAAGGTTLANDRLFVIGGDRVTPMPDAVVALTLQNGPDAIRIVASDGAVLDVVGYGGLDDTAYVETRAVPAVTAGQSVARAIDGVDTNDNAADFVAASPTPGRRNVARHDVGLVLGEGTAARAARAAPGTERVAVRVVNLGLEPVPAGAVEIAARDSTPDAVTVGARAANAGAIAPGGSERVQLSVPLGPGYHWIQIEAHYPPDERIGNETAMLVRRASRIPLLVSEVWSAPRDGCPQFIELLNAGGAPVEVAGFSVRDRRARPVVLATQSLRLEPGAPVAITPDPAALLACAPGAPPSRVIGVTGTWPVFNRSGGPVADSVVVLDAFGIPVDAVGYPAVGSSLAGRSLERVDLFLGDGPAVWRLSSARNGCSPGEMNSASLYEAPAAGRVEASPNPFSPYEGNALRIALNPGARVTRMAVRVYDTDGRRIADLGAASAFPSLVLWDGRDTNGVWVRPGIYVVACEAYLADGARAGVEKVVVGCAARTR